MDMDHQEVIDENWQSKYIEMQVFFNKENRLPTHRESTLGKWITTQRSNYNKNLLKTERIELLERLDFWKWQIK